jgi:orotidine-5'-phosphate decarboxylase
MTIEPRIIVALDYPDEAPALALLQRLEPGRCRVKIGKELFTRAGPRLVERVVGAGFDVFLDLKFHDIPNTTAAACAAAAELGVWMVNVHASGGPAMLAAARERLSAAERPPLLIAVPVLTSLDATDLDAIGCPGEPASRVLRLATLARDAGLDGIVCSAQEATAVRSALGAGFKLVTPGIRPALGSTSPGASNTAQGDQKRVMTPAQALAAGADFLVIGRPITAAADPMVALAAIEADMAGAG